MEQYLLMKCMQTSKNYGCLGHLYAKNKQLNKAYEYYNSKNKADRNFIEQKLNALKEQIFET